jgi:hypothetical protein
VRDEPYYKDLEELVLRSRRCVAFVGSGLSMGQYPSWSELIADLCKACGRATDAETARNTKDPNTLATLADVAHDNDSEAYYRVLDTVFGHRVTSTRAAYDLLMRLPFASYVNKSGGHT